MHWISTQKSAGLNHLLGKRFFRYYLLGICLIGSMQVHAQIISGSQEKYGMPVDSNQVLDAIKKSRDLHKTHPAGQDDIEVAQRAVDLALESQDTLLFARALDNVGLLYRYHKQYQQSLPLHIKAFELIRNMPAEPLYKMIFANNAGVAARYMDRYDESVYYYLEALKIAEKENNLKNIAISSNGLGNALGSMPNRRKEAMDYFNRALKAEEKQNNFRGMAMNLLSISHYHIDQKQYHLAREVLARLAAFNQKLDDEHGLAITDQYFGISYLEEGRNLQAAAGYFKKSLNLFEKLGDKPKQAELLAHLANVSETLKQYSTALQYYHQSQTLADTVTSKALIMANAYRMSDIYLQQNNSAKALEYYKLARRYEDSINLHRQGIQIAAITQNHEIEKKETEIERLEAEKKSRNSYILLQEEKIQQQQTILLLAMFSFVTGISVVALIFRNIKAKRKSARQLEEQEKETLQAIYERNLAQADMLASRLRMNPHFTFNSLNAINNLVQQQKNDLASTYLIAFSRFIRMVLETSQRHVVTLEEELDLLNRYLKLEKNRFDDQFIFQLEMEGKNGLRDILVPPLLLQPIAENAIWHGLMPSRKDKKELLVKVESICDGVTVRLTDNGVGRQAGKKRPGHTSMGASLTQERIELYNQSYEAEITYTITDLKDEGGLPAGTSIEIKIIHQPIKPQPQEIIKTTHYG